MALNTKSFRGLFCTFLFLVLFGLVYWISQGAQSPTARGEKETLTPAATPATVAKAAAVAPPPMPREAVRENAEPVRELAQHVPYAPTTDSSEDEINTDPALLEARNKDELRIRKLRNGGE